MEVFVLFGATGSLSKKKLFPALYKLHYKKKFSGKFSIIGIGRSNLSQKEFKKYVTNIINENFKNPASLKSFLKRIYYISCDLTKKEDFDKIHSKIKKLDKKANVVFYLAVSPRLFPKAVLNIKKSGLAYGNGWRRIVIEKPFGYDFKSAKKLYISLKTTFSDEQVYHLDHYLGKELVQNILSLRFSNPIFEKLWGYGCIDHVQVTVMEKEGIKDRAGYYEKTGALRDMMQSHLMQILALVAMEPPQSLSPDNIRKEKIRVLDSVYSHASDAVRGQYSSGYIDNEKVHSYRKEIGVNSNTETYAAVKLHIKNKRWKGIPFYLRTGKRLGKKYAEVNIVFKHDRKLPFYKMYKDKIEPDILRIYIQPEEGIKIFFNAKVPSGGMKPHQVEMNFCHSCLFSPMTLESYEHLIRDIIIGDRTLFVSWKEIQQEWKIIDSIKKHWSKSKPKFPNYQAGSNGPQDAASLIEKDGRKWINN